MKRNISYPILAYTCIIVLLFAISCSHNQSQSHENYSDIEDRYYQLKSVNTDTEKEVLKAYVCDTLNFAELYDSPVWDKFIEDWISLFSKNPAQAFPTDEFTYISKRIIERTAIENPEIIESLVRKSAEVLIGINQEKIAACIVAYSNGINISANDDSEIAMRLLTAMMLRGTKAPALIGLEWIGNKEKLVIFYDSNCPDCKSLLSNITDRYEELSEKGIDIISLSADTDKTLYTKYAENFPWKNKLCDYQSFSSGNFKNYGVAAVPIMYLIDSDGLVVDRFDTLEETDLLHKESDIKIINDEKKALR
ncbi:thioredoxin family protein [uncultured Dysgonomonas sp.]|uniref:Thioredoxin domain-containing protein n=1 Tax=uncultured Dysgonomonas sp. TaxID=206096 RepID=A0A212K462_9BACT|nr:thioredoxin family protein [uncultured Dysgonomonas sp.]SBW06509.1 conserved exported hypothetical protein [uncultured Dysgonomonas sp.]